jgi:hypothetical protein
VALYVSSFNPYSGDRPRPLAVTIYQQSVVIAGIVNIFESVRALFRDRRRPG